MKRALPLLMMLVMSVSAFASSKVQNWKDLFAGEPESQELVAGMPELTMESFLELTPKKYEELTGQKMSIGETIRLKAAQKHLRKQMEKPNADIEKPIYIVLSIFGLGWLAMGLLDDWQGSDWIINLVLAVVFFWLCALPALVHALVKMKNYY